MRLQRDGLSAVKAWLFTDRFVLCLGAGIRTDSALTVTTAVDQRWQRGPLEVWKGGRWQRAAQVSGRLRRPCRLFHDQTGYVLLDGRSFEAKAERRSGRWDEVMGMYPSDPVQGDVLSVCIGHGASPKGETYAYLVFPAATREEVAQFSEREVRLLRNDAEAQVVDQVIRRAIEPGNNFFSVTAVKVSDHIWLMSGMLIFYVIYTLWYGFSIFELFEGIGLAMTKSKVKQEKDEYVSRAGIDSYRTGSESDAVVRQDLEKMRTEVESIRKLLQFELAGLLQDNRSRNEPVKAMVFKLLHSVGFSDKVADSLVNRLPAEITFNDAWREIVSLLERAILVGDDDIVSKGGIVTLIGPAGVGKTTTLAKLAARFVMRYGPQRVAIVTADHYRIGAVEQIKTYGRIMGCATFAVKNLSELPQLLYTLSDKSLILVDTAGVGFKDERFNVQLTQLKQQASLQLKHYLVLPCTTQRKVLQHAYDHFAMVGLTGLILTKIDECQNLGDALSLCIEMKLPISYITDGQRVPEDLDIPNPSSMARRALAAVEDDAAQGLLPHGL